MRSRALGPLLLCLLAAPLSAAELADCDAPTHARVLQAAPAGAPSSATAAFLNGQVLRWPGSEASRFALYHSASAQLHAEPGSPVQGADGRIEMEGAALPLPVEVEAAHAWRGSGPTLAVPADRRAELPQRWREQLLLVAEDEQGRVQAVTGVQLAAALDAHYGDAAEALSLGAHIGEKSTDFALWAPTAQAVSLCLHAGPQESAQALLAARRDEASGSWRVSQAGDLRGHYYRWLVDVVVPGVGLVRNRVTDPYSLSLSADSAMTAIIDLDDPALMPDGWQLARTSHTPPTADADRSDKTWCTVARRAPSDRLDVVSTTLAPVSSPRAAPRRHLRALATERHEKCGLNQHARRSVDAATDMVIYELHVRDFSISDASVPQADRGRYRAFMHQDSVGMRHLRALAEAGLSDVHLLPVFDLATVPEQACITPQPGGAPDGSTQQALIELHKAEDCFNWGYDPWHYTAPEGSYASDAMDAAVRVREFRMMVQALHAAGLRVGMDVVYNHTTASGQDARSVLDRIVPGYYHRLDRDGRVERSTCCDNTATEHRLMAKLMIDSVQVWARDYRIDSFRFDLMGHQPKAVMLALREQVEAAAGRRIDLLGEGWNFGEVADGRRFEQASQRSLSGTGIATFSDRARDAVRGGGCCDEGNALLRQGYVNGLHYAANGAHAASLAELLRAADLVRVGLAGSLRDYRLHSHDGVWRTLAEIDYAGQPAGYVAAPDEVVNYVENHDNQTLYDINVLKLPLDTSTAERARVQVLALAINAFSQGIAYFHAGGELLRSKSLDRNSYDSGDWFNRLDYSGADNNFGVGLPPARDNQASWAVMQPRLANAALKPAAVDIDWTRRAFLDLLRIRASSSLFRLRSAAEVRKRLHFLNTGPAQQPTLLAARLDGAGLADAGFAEMIYLINVGLRPATLQLPAQAGRDWVLHPVHRAAQAADRRPLEQARFDASSGAFEVPARTALVWVREAVPLGSATGQ